ncbi:hypothetical protein EDD17DRAFT_1509531 [Pisolithus thermaeus]|nr:hypothetical protein EV401DRAFT_1891271 [Pisolithus croceorrhizus]KAI6161057.1 hypothetical protein EDD17DRAFT_1509531 [Pisolithus thermaeus]
MRSLRAYTVFAGLHLHVPSFANSWYKVGLFRKMRIPGPNACKSEKDESMIQQTALTVETISAFKLLSSLSGLQLGVHHQISTRDGGIWTLQQLNLTSPAPHVTIAYLTSCTLLPLPKLPPECGGRSNQAYPTFDSHTACVMKKDMSDCVKHQQMRDVTLLKLEFLSAPQFLDNGLLLYLPYLSEKEYHRTDTIRKSEFDEVGFSQNFAEDLFPNLPFVNGGEPHRNEEHKLPKELTLEDEDLLRNGLDDKQDRAPFHHAAGILRREAKEHSSSCDGNYDALLSFKRAS